MRKRNDLYANAVSDVHVYPGKTPQERNYFVTLNKVWGTKDAETRKLQVILSEDDVIAVLGATLARDIGMEHMKAFNEVIDMLKKEKEA